MELYTFASSHSFKVLLTDLDGDLSFEAQSNQVPKTAFYHPRNISQTSLIVNQIVRMLCVFIFY